MSELADQLDAVAGESGFSGVVRVQHGSDVLYENAFGRADRRHHIANTVATRFGIASGAKGFTALVVMRLIEQGRLELATTARSLLGRDLPLIDSGVTVEHLLSHRSGIGDYLDEELLDDASEYVMTVPVHELATAEEYLSVLAGHEQKFAPGDRFSYCNGGFVVLALLAERAAGVSFFDLVDELVCRPAAMQDTAFLRSDALPGEAALGYLTIDGLQTNVLHLPVRGSGDGGIYTTTADIHALWDALFAGRIVSADSFAAMTRPQGAVDTRSYGLGFWLDEQRDLVWLEGGDPGVGFRSVRRRETGHCYTVISNCSAGSRPTGQLLNEWIGQA